MAVTFGDNTKISNYGKPYIVAEVNSSHSGDVRIGRAMIDAASEAGCDCVKFQSWSANSLYSRNYREKNSISMRVVSKFSLSEAELLEMAGYCKSVGVSFSSTPYSKREADFLLARCGAPFIKIASMDIDNIPFISYVARTGAPIVLSTGMAEMSEIHAAVEAIAKAGNKELCILHCVSVYPADCSIINLNNIKALQEAFPDFPIGYSDHTAGVEIAPAAVAMGAALIEKHMTLDRAKIGMDNQMAVEPDDMARLARGCRDVYAAMGSHARTVSETEQEQRLKMRRSVAAARDLKAGRVITEEDLDAKRPGGFIPLSEMPSLVGKTLARDVPKDMLLEYGCFR